MRVAVLAHAHHPIATPFAGGLESFTWDLVDGLVRKGIDVRLYAADGSEVPDGVDVVTFEPVELSAQARGDVNMPPEVQVADAFAYQGAMADIRQRSDVDIVHNNSLHFLPITMAGTLAVPVLTTLHTPPTPWLEPALRTTKHLTPTVAVSHAVARWWNGVTTPRVIHNGTDLTDRNVSDGGPDLVWFGRLVPEKAPHIAAKIARKAGMSLRIAGPIADRAYFERFVGPELDEQIHYVGHLRRKELDQLVGGSVACLVTPDWDEPFGLVAVEAMACGTPVLAFDRGGLAEVVQLPGGLVVSQHGDEERLIEQAAATLHRVVGLDRQQVRGWVEEHFDLTNTVNAYVALYEELTA